MNRENKKKHFKKGYYKTHACTDSFTCKPVSYTHLDVYKRQITYSAQQWYGFCHKIFYGDVRSFSSFCTDVPSAKNYIA